MMMRLFFIIIFVFGFSGWLIAQEPEVERLLEQQEEYSDMSDLLEMLAELEQNPIDLNQATAEQLAVLPWISNILAAEIINYRNQIGSFNSIDELSQIDSLDPELIPVLRKYVTASHLKIRKNFSFMTKNRLVRKIDTSIAGEDSIFSPLPCKFYNRFTLNYKNNLRFGLLLEKDSGERHFDDLKVYFLSYHSNTNQSKLIIGNYRLEFAQGLVFGNPYGHYKGSDPIFPAEQRGRELLGYTIVDENASLYGISAQACFKIYQFFIFFSNNKLDATLNDNGTVKNFYTSGYHRTSSELTKKDCLTERLVGSRVQIKPGSYLSFGATYYRSFYNPTFVTPDENENRFHFDGSENQLIGFDYNFTLGRWNLFGELARSQNNGLGILAGMLMDNRQLKLLILGRDYSKNFISFYGNSFKEQGAHPQNEQGIYCGFQFKPVQNLELGFYFDQYRFPWRTYSVPMPAHGKDLLWRAECRAFKNLVLLLQYKFESKEDYVNEIKQVILRCQNRLRFQLEFQPTAALKLRCRIEKKWINYKRYYQLQSRYPHYFEGILLYQDINLKMSHKFDVAARLAFFDADDYESRLYQFEHDVPGMLTNQMLYGMGTRGYIRIQWRPAETLNLAIKVGSTQYHRIGSQDLKPEKISNSINLQLETNW